ncbi:MAG: HPr family phosphocarrier protein [Lachnospiraceae bacterium]|nr:HPr family phosphocarrier protein [Lachnospiraceae bacterium]
MVQGSVKVINVKGLHIKPAGAMSKIALSMPCKVYLKVREYEVNAKSVLGILSAQVKCNEEITIVCDGEGEETILKELTEAVQNGFGIE